MCKILLKIWRTWHLLNWEIAGGQKPPLGSVLWTAAVVGSRRKTGRADTGPLEGPWDSRINLHQGSWAGVLSGRKERLAWTSSQIKISAQCSSLSHSGNAFGIKPLHPQYHSKKKTGSSGLKKRHQKTPLKDKANTKMTKSSQLAFT